MYFSWQFFKECLEIAKYWFGFCIVQLMNTVVIYCLHISCMGALAYFALCLHNIGMHNYPQAVAFWEVRPRWGFYTIACTANYDSWFLKFMELSQLQIHD